jgi:ABC-2 type transport system permease protein
MSVDVSRPYGPSALGEDYRRFIELTMTLARTEFKVRYFGSALGYLWSLLRPLLFFGVIYVFFTQILNLSKGVPHYGVYLLTGIVLWSYLGEASAGCVSCLVARESLLRKIRFPRLVVPLSVSLTAAFNLGLNAIVAIAFALLNGVPPSVSWLELIPIALCFVILATGLGMLLSALYVRFRDVQPMWDVALQAWFYCSPVMYVAARYSKLSPGFERLALLNPASTLLTQMGHAVIGGPKYPSAISVAGLPTVTASLAIILATFGLGAWFFTREAPRVAENL